MSRTTEGRADTGKLRSWLIRAAFLIGGLAASALAAALMLLLSNAIPGPWLGPKVGPALAYGMVTFVLLFPPPSEMETILGAKVGARNSIAFSIGWALVLVAAFYSYAFSSMP